MRRRCGKSIERSSRWEELEYGKPVVATCDAHYFDAEEALYRRIIMAGQGFKDV